MKYILSLLLLTLLVGTSYSQEGKYTRFKTGTFTYNDGVKGVKITRTKKKQVEIYPDGVSKVITKIKWLSDSSYILTFKKSNVAGCLKKGDWIKVTFIREDGDSYTCKYSSENCGEGVSNVLKLE